MFSTQIIGHLLLPGTSYLRTFKSGVYRPNVWSLEVGRGYALDLGNIWGCARVWHAGPTHSTRGWCIQPTLGLGGAPVPASYSPIEEQTLFCVGKTQKATQKSGEPKTKRPLESIVYTQVTTVQYSVHVPMLSPDNR